jgi:RHS repeat-associated protein
MFMGKSAVRSKALFGLSATFVVAAMLQAASAFAGDTVYYYYTDAQGTPVVETDAQGNVIERTYYAPYGQVLNRDLRDGPGYTRHEEDPETGLVYMQQRYYCPECGRFLSVDPVGVDPTNAGNFNRYEYANDNPYRYTDPDGRFECGNKQSCEVGTAISNGLKQAQAHYKVGSQAYTKLGNEIKFLGTANDGNKLTVTAVSDKNSTYIGMGAWDKKTGTGTLTVNLANVTNPAFTKLQNTANFVATGAHEIKHAMDDRNSATPTHNNVANEFWHEVRGVRAETPVWEGYGVEDPMWHTWSPDGGLDMRNVYKEAKASTDAYCPNGQCP